MSPFTKEALEAQAEHWQEEARRQKRFRSIEGIVGLVALGMLISFTLWYTAHVQAKADQRWCNFMVPLNERYQRLPADAPSEAKEFAGQLRVLVSDLKC